MTKTEILVPVKLTPEQIVATGTTLYAKDVKHTSSSVALLSMLFGDDARTQIIEVQNDLADKTDWTLSAVSS